MATSALCLLEMAYTAVHVAMSEIFGGARG